MKEPKTDYIQTLIIVLFLLVSLPFFYFLFSKVLIPLEWKEEPAMEQEVSTQ